MKIAGMKIFFIVVGISMSFGNYQAEAQETIRIGCITPLTGGGSLLGLTAKEGFTMGVEDLNARGGINGKKLDVIVYDSTTKPPVAATLAQRLILEDKVPLINVGTGSLDALAMMEVTERAKIPLFISRSASPMITEKGYKWVWRMSLNDKVSAEMLGKYIGQRPNWNRIAFLYENTDYGKPPCEVLIKVIGDMKGKEVVAVETYNRGDTDISGQIWKIKNSNPNVLVTWGYYTEGALIARQAKQIGLKAQLIGNQAIGFPEYIQLAGAAAEGVMHVNSSSSHINPDPKIQAFVKRFEEKFKRTPSMTSVDNYDGVFVIAEILKKVGTDPVKIQNALNTMTFQGIAETIRFDAKGQGVKGAIIVKVEGNNFKFVEYLRPPEK
jgi:branched-chain amino acid transport system substrate-binding protein